MVTLPPQSESNKRWCLACFLSFSHSNPLAHANLDHSIQTPTEDCLLSESRSCLLDNA